MAVKSELDALTKSADAHVATCKNKNVEAAREHHIRGSPNPTPHTPNLKP